MTIKVTPFLHTRNAFSVICFYFSSILLFKLLEKHYLSRAIYTWHLLICLKGSVWPSVCVFNLSFSVTFLLFCTSLSSKSTKQILDTIRFTRKNIKVSIVFHFYALSRKYAQKCFFNFYSFIHFLHSKSSKTILHLHLRLIKLLVID